MTHHQHHVPKLFKLYPNHASTSSSSRTENQSVFETAHSDTQAPIKQEQTKISSRSGRGSLLLNTREPLYALPAVYKLVKHMKNVCPDNEAPPRNSKQQQEPDVRDRLLQNNLAHKLLIATQASPTAAATTDVSDGDNAHLSALSHRRLFCIFFHLQSLSCQVYPSCTAAGKTVNCCLSLEASAPPVAA